MKPSYMTMNILQRFHRRPAQLTHMDAFPQVDAVVYINLEKRKDRRVQVEAELRRCIPESKIHRFNAVYERPGWFGCSRSHIEVLRWAEEMGWNAVMVVEDDVMWTDAFRAGLEKLPSFPSPDVIMLCGSSPIYDPVTSRVTSASAATAYIVRKEYIPILRANFEEGLANLRANPARTDLYCVDQHWKRLMEKDRWYIVVPGMATQRPGFSDLAQGYVDHRSDIA